MSEDGPVRGVRESNAAAVLAAVRTGGSLSRTEIARRTGLSVPTVSRQVAALTKLELLAEFPDPQRQGEVGRPTVPVGLDDVVIAAGGIHVGVTTTTYGLTSLRGDLLGSERIPTPSGSADDVLARIAEAVRGFLGRWRGRRIIGVGLAIGGQVDAGSGLLNHARLGWHGVPARAVLERAIGLPVQVDGHVPAMAAAELLFGAMASAPTVRRAGTAGAAGAAGTALYFYAREMVGVAFAVGGTLHRGPGRSGSITHLPVGGTAPCACGRTGCLEVTVAEQAVLDRAVRAGVIGTADIGSLRAAAEAGDPGAHDVLTERARALGRAVGLVRDVVDPDLVVLGGQAITDAPGYLDVLRSAFAKTTNLPGTDLVEVTRFGPDVQAMAACTGVLTRLYDRPLSTLDGVAAPAGRVRAAGISGT